MLVDVKIGSKIVYRGGSEKEVLGSKLKKNILNSKDFLPEEIFKTIVCDEEDLLSDIIESLNPKYNPQDKLLLWRLESFVNKPIMPNLGSNFKNMFFPNGFMRGELYVVSAISGGGKTSFGIHITSVLASGYNAYSDCKKGDKAYVIYVSLEQSRKQIEARLYSILSATLFGNTDLSYSEILTGKNVFTKSFKDALDAYSLLENRIKIIDYESFNGSPTIEELKARLSYELLKIPNREKCLVILDRYENVIGANSNVDDTVARELKNFALQENVPVLVQCQMAKAAIEAARLSNGGFNSDKLSASSLKGTSGLEHHCSNVIILVPENVNSKNEKIIKFIQPKNRYGKNSEYKMIFHGSCGLFTEFIETRGRKKKFNGDVSTVENEINVMKGEEKNVE